MMNPAIEVKLGNSGSLEERRRRLIIGQVNVISIRDKSSLISDLIKTE